MNVTIYALVDPRLPAVIRYVGQTYHPSARHLQHCRIRKPRSSKESWIESIRAEGVLPQMLLLEVTDATNANDAEKLWSSKYTSLTNDRYSPVRRALYREPWPTTTSPWRLARIESDRSIIVTALTSSSGNMSTAARLLGISRPTLYERVARLGITPSDFDGVKEAEAKSSFDAATVVTSL